MWPFHSIPDDREDVECEVHSFESESEYRFQIPKSLKVEQESGVPFFKTATTKVEKKTCTECEFEEVTNREHQEYRLEFNEVEDGAE